MSATAFAAERPVCETGLSANVQSLLTVLKKGLVAQAMTVEDLKIFVDKVEWSNPFATASATLKMSVYSHAFAELEKTLTNAEKERAKTLVRDLIGKMGSEREVVESARIRTTVILYPKSKIYQAIENEYFEPGIRPKGAGKFEGRPVFVKHMYSRESESSYVEVIFDPFNSDPKKRIFTIPSRELTERENPFFFSDGKSDYVAYLNNGLILGFQSGKNDFDKFATRPALSPPPIEKMQLIKIGEIPYLYFLKAIQPTHFNNPYEKYELVMLNTTQKAVTKFQVGMVKTNVSNLTYHDKAFLVWADVNGLMIFDPQNGSQVETKIESNWVNALEVFEYKNQLFAFVSSLEGVELVELTIGDVR